MDGIEWATPSTEHRARLEAAAFQQMVGECDRAAFIETGGILIGYHTADRSAVIIAEALPPPEDSSQGPTWFHRGAAGLQELLKDRWESEPRTFFVGEWHYHPASIVEPSHADLEQMKEISADPLYQCPEPLMFIVGKAREGKERPIRGFVFPQGLEHKEFFCEEIEQEALS